MYHGLPSHIDSGRRSPHPVTNLTVHRKSWDPGWCEISGKMLLRRRHAAYMEKPGRHFRWREKHNKNRACHTGSIHYNDVIMGAMVSQITSLTIVYSTVYSKCRSKKEQSSASPAFVRGIHRWPVNSPHKGPVTRKMSSWLMLLPSWLSLSCTGVTASHL